MPTHFPVPPTTKAADDRNRNRSLQHSVAAFRACHERYNACLDYQNLRTKSLVNETVNSYILDFDLASKRAIGADRDRYRLFQLHFLQGYSAAETCEKLGIVRFTFAKEVAEIEKLAGKAFTQRGLFPLGAYFEGETNVTAERRAA